MSPELEFLVSSVLFGLAQIIISSHSASFRRGYRWTASSREQNVPPLTGMAGRIERATRNYLETFPFFAAAVLLVLVLDLHNWMTLYGAALYFFGRILYFILYVWGATLMRSLVWNVPTLGIVLILAGYGCANGFQHRRHTQVLRIRVVQYRSQCKAGAKTVGARLSNSIAIAQRFIAIYVLRRSILRHG